MLTINPQPDTTLFLFDGPTSPTNSTSTSTSGRTPRRRTRSGSSPISNNPTAAFFASSFTASPPPPPPSSSCSSSTTTRHPPSRKSSVSKIAVETSPATGFVFMGGGGSTSPTMATTVTPRKRPSLLSLGTLSRPSPRSPTPESEAEVEDVVMSSPTLLDPPSLGSSPTSPSTSTSKGTYFPTTTTAPPPATPPSPTVPSLPVWHVPLHRSHSLVPPRPILLTRPVSPFLDGFSSLRIPTAADQMDEDAPSTTSTDPKRWKWSRPSTGRTCGCRTCRSFSARRIDSEDQTDDGSSATEEEESTSGEGEGEDGASVVTAETSPALSLSLAREVVGSSSSDLCSSPSPSCSSSSSSSSSMGLRTWGKGVRFCEAAAEQIVTWPATTYDRRGPPPVAKLTMRDVLELREVKQSLGVLIVPPSPPIASPPPPSVPVETVQPGVVSVWTDSTPTPTPPPSLSASGVSASPAPAFTSSCSCEEPMSWDPPPPSGPVASKPVEGPNLQAEKKARRGFSGMEWPEPPIPAAETVETVDALGTGGTVSGTELEFWAGG